MKPIISFFIITFSILTCQAVAQDTPIIEYEQYTLKNGLRVIVHEDRKAPIVNVNVWYHVGSKDEPDGKSGFAHLFEHLMFNGSENYDDDFFKPLQEIGASGINGTTSRDRTNYYQTVPRGGLDRILWMESDRMGHLLGAVNEDKITEQRDVVKNEKRQGENRPGGKLYYRIYEGVYPKDHPYHHSTIGSMEDLDSASVEDVHEWFKAYYGPNNAVIVLSGDIDAEESKPLMEKYFGDIPAGPPMTQRKQWVPIHDSNRYEVMEDHVPQTYMTWSWAIPGRTTKEYAELEVAASIFGGGRNSRLYEKLVHEEERVNSASASLVPGELSGMFMISAELKFGEDPDEIAAIIEDMLADFLAKGPTRKELNRVKTVIDNSLIRAMESISSKGSLLASGAIYDNNPGFIHKKQAWQSASTLKSIREVSNKWLNHGFLKMDLVPFGRYDVTESTADRSAMPDMTSTSAIKLPPLQTATLENGIEVVLAERRTVPTVTLAMRFDAGSVTDHPAKDGIADFTFGNMNEGTKSLESLDFADRKTMLGARIGFGNGLDSSNISLSALKKNLTESIELWADVIRNPGFRPVDIERDRSLTLASLENAKMSPGSIAGNLMSTVLYGSDHVYSGRTIAEKEEAIKSIKLQDLQDFHDLWIRPDNAKIYVVGDTTLEKIVEELNNAFGDWENPNRAKGDKNLTDAAYAEETRIILVDRPGAVQSIIQAAHLVSPSTDDNAFNINAMNDILGGEFTSRINMNLREDKGWSYGAGSYVSQAIRQRSFRISTSVQTDKTALSMQEILKELKEYQNDRPPTDEEMMLMVKGQTLPLPGRFATNTSLINYIMSNEHYGRPYNYAETLAGKYTALTPEVLQQTAKENLRPDAMYWVIVGDLSKIEQNIRDLNLGTIEVWDANGKKQR
ncbi:M16 family metallopeptidase [Pseudemcibacter aquimaris]|uniref:M16 family metallopeptidase n=1 Tax=Pseudemcibacter aquimaris TaxID=2857064 RepID=UPI00201276EA|nr:pitrilysin family protein [Pseudemcibacter aquimaris]MCC3861702.1 insulinase family protein [Pseudemcibacter aquimaris]WDU58472.1 insulinase family protein [Pseudemcibacter aquimaris]